MEISAISNVSFGNKRKVKEENNNFSQVKKGLEVTKELTKYMGTEKIGKRLERIPEQDQLFINTPEIDIENGKYTISNPELIYCEDYNNTQNKKREILTFEVDIEKGLDKKAIKKWLDKILSKA